ncbi:MoaD/ThiS family protein [Longimicrobium sp.]|uniref:MoaD/ThiS family protein n=1 Tax=Longimicrobium sp. TaxID=2029185 RepID=UPI002E332D67|nr:MoaD/ThiS family protein [Longimicrobium sp.]HEX6038511.1 MoaD/ThiS family protein [Longimicrobium sp.]
MNVRVCLPAPLQPYAEGRAEVPLAAGTVEEAIAALAARYPGMAPHLLADGRLRTFLAVFLNDDDVRHRGGLSAALADGDVLTLVPGVAGGAGHAPG